MTPRRRAICSAVAAAGACAGALAVAGLESAIAGHTDGYASSRTGTCDGYPNGYITCRTNYAIGDPWLHVRDIRDFTDESGTSQAPLYTDPLGYAEAAWNNAELPLLLGVTAFPNDTWNYITARRDPDGRIAGDPSNVLGVTYLCNDEQLPPLPVASDRRCTDTLYGGLNVKWADIYLNNPLLAAQSIALRQQTIAHELGHSFGLAHHCLNGDSGCQTPVPALMFPAAQESIPGPTGIDLGRDHECRDGTAAREEWGLRCIYDWYSTATRTPVPTATNTPVGGGGGGGGGCTNGKC